MRRRGRCRPTGSRISNSRNLPRISPTVRTTLVVVAGGQHHRYPNAALLQGFSNGLTAWSPDGRRVALVAAQSNQQNTIWIFDSDARDQFRQLLELPVTVRVRGITWSPDGSLNHRRPAGNEERHRAVRSRESGAMTFPG